MKIKRFSQINEEVGEENEELFSDLSGVWNDLNVIYLLLDEGYINGVHLREDIDVLHVNSFIENTIGHPDFFDAREDVYTFCIDTFRTMEEVGKKCQLKFR